MKKQFATPEELKDYITSVVPLVDPPDAGRYHGHIHVTEQTGKILKDSLGFAYGPLQHNSLWVDAVWGPEIVNEQTSYFITISAQAVFRTPSLDPRLVEDLMEKLRQLE